MGDDSDSVDANDDSDDDTDSFEVTDSVGESVDESAEEINAGTNTDDDINSDGSLTRNQGRDNGLASIFGANGDSEGGDYELFVSFSTKLKENVWAMAGLIMAMCLVSACLYRRKNPVPVRYDEDELPV